MSAALKARDPVAYDLRLCSLGDIPVGEPLRVDVQGHPPFAVYHVEGQVYVTEDTCTHGKASLGEEGELDGFLITCTWHDGVFDIRTGEVKAVPCTHPLRTFPATVIDGDVHIQTPE